MTNYSSIPSDQPASESMELTRRESSVSNGSAPHKTLVVSIGIASVALAYLLGLRAGGGTGGGVGSAEKVVLPTEAAGVTQLCEIYHDGPVSVIQTSRGEPSKQWKEVGCIRRSRGLKEGQNVAPSAAVIDVDYSQVPFGDRVPILGFGGAFTEAAALNYGSLNEQGQSAVMELLFGKEGLGYR